MAYPVIAVNRPLSEYIPRKLVARSIKCLECLIASLADRRESFLEIRGSGGMLENTGTIDECSVQAQR